MPAWMTALLKKNRQPKPTFTVRCRTIILNQGKMLVVRHSPEASFWALPGGHLEYGEGLEACAEREIVEELGIAPDIGRLLYMHTFESGGVHSVEFLFEVLNGAMYGDLSKLSGTHSYELADIRWVSPADDVRILPARVATDFKAGEIGRACPLFITN